MNSKFFWVGLFFILLFGSPNLYAQNSPNWNKDIKMFEEKIKSLHIKPFHSITENEFDQKISGLRNDAGSLDIKTFNYRLAEIVASIGDMHTRMSMITDYHFPFKIFLFEEGFYIRAVSSNNKELLGDKIISINGHPIESVFETLKKITSADNKIGYWNNTVSYLEIPDLLKFYGIIPDLNQNIPISFEKAGPVKIKPLKDVTSEENMIHVFQQSENPVPLYLRNLFSKPYQWEYLESEDLFYWQINTIRDFTADYSFEAMTKDALSRIREIKPQKLVLDLRWNGGGNDPAYRSSLPKLISTLIENDLNREDRFYTIIGRYTASAAQHLVNDLEYLTNTTFIGEPTKQNVQFFSDSRVFELPTSGLIVAVSTGWLQNYKPYGIEDRTIFYPDIGIPLEFSDFKNNQDAVLEYIINH